MPMYEFQCNNCQQVTEELASIGTEYVLCPACAGRDEIIRAYRILSPTRTNFVFADTTRRKWSVD